MHSRLSLHNSSSIRSTSSSLRWRISRIALAIHLTSGLAMSVSINSCPYFSRGSLQTIWTIVFFLNLSPHALRLLLMSQTMLRKLFQKMFRLAIGLLSVILFLTVLFYPSCVTFFLFTTYVSFLKIQTWTIFSILSESSLFFTIIRCTKRLISQLLHEEEYSLIFIHRIDL